MKSKSFTLNGYSVLMETPKHGSVAEAELKAMKMNPTGATYVNQSEYTTNLIAASIKSVKKDDKELINDFDSAVKFINDLPENAFVVLGRVYRYLVDSSEYELLVKNLELVEPSPSSKTP